VPMYDGELFEEEDWLTLFEAQGLRPRRYNALAAALPLTQVDEHCAKLRQAIIAGVKTLPSHADYLRSIHAAPVRGAAA
jgi:tryptophan halogenase